LRMSLWCLVLDYQCIAMYNSGNREQVYPIKLYCWVLCHILGSDGVQMFYIFDSSSTLMFTINSYCLVTDSSITFWNTNMLTYVQSIRIYVQSILTYVQSRLGFYFSSCILLQLRRIHELHDGLATKRTRKSSFCWTCWTYT
jgi:hypothetical protein